MKLEQLPEKPTRPHPFYDLETIELQVPVAELGRSVAISCKVAGDGPPIVLIHGLMTSSYSFRYITTLLAEHYRVFVPDMPGAGQSEAPVELSMHPASVARFLGSLIGALDVGAPYVVGNSLGGYQCLWLLLLEPQRFERLMVMHSPGFPIGRMYALRAALGIPGAFKLFERLACRDPELFVARNVHYHFPEILSREETREYGAIFRDPARTRVFFQILRDGLAPAPMREFQRALRARRERGDRSLPIRLLWAERDKMVPPAFGPRYNALLPEAELVWMSGVSHFMHVDDPAATAEQLLRFDREG
ncbi:MAG: alpha/beta hydrolase [Myxococcales bacterium]|nr:alpha/beta hydrolase [Myxococcales bacterium]